MTITILYYIASEVIINQNDKSISSYLLYDDKGNKIGNINCKEEVNFDGKNLYTKQNLSLYSNIGNLTFEQIINFNEINLIFDEYLTPLNSIATYSSGKFGLETIVQRVFLSDDKNTIKIIVNS